MRWIVGLLASVFLSLPAVAQDTALQTRLAIDGQGNVIHDAVIVVHDGRIVSVRPNDGIPQGAREVDLTKFTVMPGLIDMHAHSYPDGVARSIDAVDLAKLAKSRGMRALVLKNHYEPTASLASIVRKEVPGIEVFGGISLDLTVGGVNPAAVEWMTKVKGGYGKVVWLPTYDSENQAGRSGRPFSPVVRNGAVTPEVSQVIAIAAKNNLVLETGHSSPAEALIIIHEARRQGVQNVMVTHAMSALVNMSIADMQAAAKMGAYLELTWVRAGSDAAEAYVKAIRAIGPEFIVLSSDLGQANNALHPDGLLAMYQYLASQGISITDIDRMAKVNPAKLLGLK